MSEQDMKTLTERLDRIERISAINAKSVIDIEEASVFTGFSVGYIYRLTSQRGIPHYKKGRKVLFNKTELEVWLQDTRVKTTSEIEAEADRYMTAKRR